MSNAGEGLGWDWALSPYTGWTRGHWEAVLARVTYGFARQVAVYGSPAGVMYPNDRADHADAVDGLEAFARLAVMWGAWLRQPANGDTLSFEGQTLDLVELLARGLAEGTNPAARTYWGDIGHMDQRIVECAHVALAVYLSRVRVLAHLSAAEQAHVVAWLAQVDGKGTYPDNWVLFPALSQMVRLRMGYAAPELELNDHLARMAGFYRGDGWYADGPGDEYDLYNAWMFGWHWLVWAWLDGERCPALREVVLQRARSFQAAFAHFFGSDGAYVAWGRSLGSRFGAVGTFALGHMLGIAPGPAGGLRRLSSGCLRYFCERGLFEPREHYLTQGIHGPNPRALERYVSPGSPNCALQGLLALTLGPDDPFWTEAEAPLPVEREDFELVLPTPGFVVSGRRETGQVLLLNSRGGHAEDETLAGYTPKYGKLAYSSHFPFNVSPAGGSYAPDAMVALAREVDGVEAFGHRGLTREGGAAPGLTWARFEQMVAGEAQPIWTAVLLRGEAQVVVAVLEPTAPVRAYYAPAALGSEWPRGIVRRSDPEQGWEYAEAEGGTRAVAVRRLRGYTAQAASQAFRGQSNLNLAYRYAEQPLVYEAEASVSARWLASVGLARPARFDPAQALEGFGANEGPSGELVVSFPNGERAAVVLAPTLPKRLVVAGTTFSGPAVRYARLAPGGSSASGLGVSAVQGMATFDGAATFRLTRGAEASVRLTTDTGARLDREWLGTDAWRAWARELDGAWVAVPYSAAGGLSAALVREWQARNERTMIDFRLER